MGIVCSGVSFGVSIEPTTSNGSWHVLHKMVFSITTSSKNTYFRLEGGSVVGDVKVDFGRALLQVQFAD